MLQIARDDPKLAACTATPGACVVYVSVYGAAGDAAFSITASTRDVSDGFRVEEPAAIAGPYAFTASGFGPRLPQDGLRACARYATPHDACQPLSNPHHEVAGAIVVLDRGSTVPGNGVGSCRYPDIQFANKVVRAQEAGAVGVIVVDDSPHGGLINMVATSHDRSDLVTIPSIFISYQDGSRLKAQIANASTPCVRVLMRESLNVPLLLVDGMPATGILHAPDTNGYSINVFRYISPAGHDDVSITLDAAFGNPDIFISADGTIPNQQHYTWAAREMGSDTLVIRGHDPKACTVCIYLISVVAVTGDVSYSLTVQAAETLRTLQPSTPLAAQEVGRGAYQYYRVFVDHSETDGMTLAITPTTGSAEIYASFDVERPSAAAGQHTWTSACQAEVVHGVSCAPTVASGAAIHIPPGRYCARMPCLLYVAVRGTEAASYSILMTFGVDETRAVALADGEVQQVSLAAAGSVARFTFVAPPSVESFVVDLMPLRGDPDLYVSANTTAWPDRRVHDLMSSSAAGETLLVRTSGGGSGADGGRGGGLCTGCEYKLVVYAFEASTDFLISATTSVGVRLLSDGVPAVGEARSEPAPAPALRYFRYFVRTASEVTLVLTPLGGNPSLFARFGCRPLADTCDYASSTTASGGSAARHTWSSTRDDGVESIVLAPGGGGGSSTGGSSSGGSSAFCVPPCTLYVGVRAEDGINCSFSLLVSQRRQGVARLVDGMPQMGVAAPNELVYYALTVDMAQGLTVSLTAFAGRPLLYYSDSTARLPTPSQHLGSVYGPDTPLVLPPVAGGGIQTLVFGVGGGADGLSNFTILPQAGGSMALLVDGQPLEGVVTAGEEKLYRIRVPVGVAAPSIDVTALQGTLRLLLSSNGVPPTEASHAVGASASPTRPCRLQLVPGSLNILSVRYLAGHAADAQASFTLLALLSPAGGGQLLDGHPQALSLQAGQPVHLRFLAYPGHPISISAQIQGGGGAGGGAGGGEGALLALHASTETRYPSQCPTGLRCAHQQAARPGEAIQLVLDRLFCGSRCHVDIELVASGADAEVTVTAATQTSAQQLQVGTTGCASASTGGGVAHFDVLVDPDDAADDVLTLALHMCSGRAELWASTRAPPSLDEPHHQYESSGSRLSPIAIPAAELAGKSRVYAAVHALHGAEGLTTFCLAATPSGRPPAETTLYDDEGRVSLLDEADGALALRFAPLAAASVGAREAVEYEVWTAVKTGGDGVRVFNSWCAVRESGWLLYNASAAALEPARRLRQLGQLSQLRQLQGPAQTDAVLRVLRVGRVPARDPSCEAGPNASAHALCPGVLYGIEHSMVLIAVVRADGQPPRRYVYQPLSWTPGGAAAAGSGGGGGGAAGVLFLLAVVLVGGALAVRYREQLRARLPPHPALDRLKVLLDRLSDHLDRLSDHLDRLRGRIRSLPLPSTPLRSPWGSGRRRRGMRTATRNVLSPSAAGSEAMDAPLTLNAYSGSVPMGALLPPIQSVATEGATRAAAALPSAQPALTSSEPNATTTTRDQSDPAYNARLARAKSARTSRPPALGEGPSTRSDGSGGCGGGSGSCGGSGGGGAAVVTATATGVEMELESCARVQVAVASNGQAESLALATASFEEEPAPVALAPLVAEQPSGVPTSMIEGMED